MDGDQHNIDYLARCVGYSLTGDTSEDAFFILWGEGDNGKSTFLEVVRALMGDYARSIDMKAFLANRVGSIPNDLARLRDARFVSSVEVAEGQRLSEELIKAVTGGDPISARFLFSEWFEFQPQFKLWLVVNHKPVIKGTDHAIWRRPRLVPFTVQIPNEERDKHLPRKLKTELSGILNWAIQGCLEWKDMGLADPPEVVAATQQYRDEMDIVGAFINDCAFLDPTMKARCKATDLFEAYKGWYETQGIGQPMGNRSLGKELKKKGVEAKKSHSVLWYFGISLLVDKP